MQSQPLHHVFFKTIKAHRSMCHEEFTRLELTAGQPKILDLLFEHDGCSQKELSQLCHIEPATMTSLLSQLERNQLVYREANPKDRRILNVYLTDKGKTSQQKVQQVFELINEVSLKGFSEEEREKTIEYLNRIYENLSGRETNLND